MSIAVTSDHSIKETASYSPIRLVSIDRHLKFGFGPSRGCFETSKYI